MKQQNQEMLLFFTSSNLTKLPNYETVKRQQISDSMHRDTAEKLNFKPQRSSKKLHNYWELITEAF